MMAFLSNNYITNSNNTCTRKHMCINAVIILAIFLMNHNRHNAYAASLKMLDIRNQNDAPINQTQQQQQERIDKLKLPKDHTLVVRLPSNILLKYITYKDVSILHFFVPENTRQAIFTFKAVEEPKSAFLGACSPRDVTLHLKAKSYPVISPQNISFPRNFLNPNQRFKIYSLQFKSNEVQQRIIVDGPQVGNWFAVAFVSYSDPLQERIEQQGLGPSCDTELMAEMSVSRFVPIIINNGQVHNGTLMRYKPQETISYTNCGADDGDDNRAPNVKFKSKPITTRSIVIHEQYEERMQPTPNDDIKAEIIDTQSFVKKHVLNAPLMQRETLPSTPSIVAAAASSLSSSICNEPNCNSSAMQLTNNEIIYKFYVPENIGVAKARITFLLACLQCPDVAFHIQANAFPYSTTQEKKHESTYKHNTIIKTNQTGEISIQFYVQPKTWHYAVLHFVKPLMMKEVFARLVENDLYNREGKQQQPKFENRMGEARELPYSLQIDLCESDHKDSATKSRSRTNESEGRSNPWKPSRYRDMEFYPLFRQNYREFFMFDYELVPDENGTVPELLNLTAGIPAGFTFPLGEVYDVGGTLSFALSMKQNSEEKTDISDFSHPAKPSMERYGILAEKLIAEPQSTAKKSGDNKSLPRSNQTIIVCMHLAEPGEPTWPDKCRYGSRLLPASSIVNNTDATTSSGLIHVPFPESGQWYVTMGLYCHGAETASGFTIIDSVKDFVKRYSQMLNNIKASCACTPKLSFYRQCIGDNACLTALNETETLKIKECLMDSKCTTNHLEMTRKFEVHHRFATEQHFALDNCSTSVIFTISSNPCVAGRCGRYGRCFHYMSGGFVFSTCVCFRGYRGWDCTDESQVPSRFSLLLATLVLTISNLLFIPSVYVAYRRKYYTEAIIYFAAMFFSTFYHACDSGEDEHSFCLVKIGVLQFCDFYCGLLAIWVTLVAMSQLRQEIVSILHMLGAILLAFGTELDKQNLWTFLIPFLTGICIISLTWGMRCYKTRQCYPGRQYVTFYLPAGATLALVGLICYAFLQTKQNYYIVHSIWHMVMALCILFLLPSAKSFIPKS
ncbi:uncharacterized protein ACN2A1_007894 isoform 1-T2 [Glossina fuscipes fuscipes]